MATLTSLGFNIFSRYDGSGVRRARLDIQRLHRNLNSASTGVNTFSGRLDLAATGASTLGAALVPLAQAAAAVGAGALSMGTAVATGLGMYGLAVQGAVKRTLELAEAGKSLTPVQATFMRNVNGMKSAWDRFLNGTESLTLRASGVALQGVTNIINQMAPVVRAFHPVVMSVANAFRDWTQRSSGLARFLSLVRTSGVEALRNLVAAGRDVLAVLGIGFRAFLPLGVQLTEVLRGAARAMRDWAEGGGFQRFIAMVQANGPAVREFFVQLWAAIRNVGSVLRGAAPAALQLATAFLRLIASTPPQTIQAIVNAWLLFRHPFAFLLLNVPVLMQLFTSLMSSMQPQDIYAVAAAFGVLRVAIIAMNAGLLSTPVGLVIIGLAAIAAGIYFLATRTRFFQTVWSAMGAAFRFVAGILVSVYRATIRPTIEAIAFLFRWVRNWADIAAAGIGKAFRWFGGIIASTLRAVIRPSILAVQFLFRWVRNWADIAASGIAAAWRFVGRVLGAVWRTSVRVAMMGIQFLFRWVRNWADIAASGIAAAWRFVGRVLGAVWRGVIRPTFNAIVGGTRWVRNWADIAAAGIAKAFRWFGGIISNVWNRTVRVAFNAMKTGLEKLRGAFQVIIGGIEKTWNRLKGITKGPVKFFVNTVYNGGLRNAWNATAGKIPGVPKLPKAPLPRGFKQGGQIPGSGSGGDRVPIMAQAGEYMIRRDRVRELGVGFFDRLNGGGISGAFRRRKARSQRRKHNHYFLGGFIEDALPDVGEIIKNVGKAASGFLNYHIQGGENIPGMGGVYDFAGGVFKSVAKEMAKQLLGPFLGVTKGIYKKFRPAGITNDLVYQNAKRGMNSMVDFLFDKAMDDSGNGYIPFRPWKTGDGARRFFRGITVNQRTMEMLIKAEGLARRKFSYFQGSFSRSVAASGGTHAGGGAVDLGPAQDSIVGHMRASGFAAWRRTPKEGFSPHIHGIAVGDSQLSGPAKQQVKDFFMGLNGLANKGPDTYGGGAGAGKGVQRWKALALQALRLAGINPNQIGAFLALMAAESGGNPRAINNWDSNAAKGQASRGLMQVIPSTFAAYRLKSLPNDIFHPLANMVAAARYIKARYGGRVPGSPYALGGLIGSYDQGGYLPPGLSLAYNGTGKPEPVGHDLARSECVHIEFNDKVYVKSELEFETMITRVVQNMKRKGRLPK